MSLPDPRTAVLGALALAAALLPAEGFRTEIPGHRVDVVAGSPTRTTAVVSVRTTAAEQGFLSYGPPGMEPRKTPVLRFPAGEPVSILLEGLPSDAAVEARLNLRDASGGGFTAGDPVRIRTARPRGGAFTFTVQADSHLDTGAEPAIYERTLRNEAADAPDFVIDLGDTFMTDKYRGDFHAALAQYEAQRWYLGLPGVPVFLALGNHDGEMGWRDRGFADDMPHWSNAQRNRLFPNPAPDGFYTGNGTKDRLNGLLRDWYAWEWGDALFVVLDPFWNTRGARGKGAEGWDWTLGEAQYRWLEETLRAGRAPFKFVFTHHLLGGMDRNCRGGAEAARMYEWGGLGEDGKPAFAERRPGWTAPVHDLLVRHGVQVVFHGHDHFFAKQDLGGIVYQMVPQPGHPEGRFDRLAAEGGYATGTFLPSPGHVRVRVSPAEAVVEFVRTSAEDPKRNGTVAHRYGVPAPSKGRGEGK